VSEFEPIAQSLRVAMTAHFETRGRSLEDPSVRNRIEDSSTAAEQRAQVIGELVFEATGESVARKRVADLGCGFGALGLWFATQGATVEGIDARKPGPAVARRVAWEHGLSAEFRKGRMEEPQLDSEAFDLAIANNSLCYLHKRAARRSALEHAHRILRPGGVLIIRDPNRWYPVDQFTSLPLIQLLGPRSAQRAARVFGRDRLLLRTRSPRAVRRELREAGFVDIHHAAFEGRSNAHRLFTRYLHFTAFRPGS
jgi:2-polyprenyl-3-methyl-5-hydroxy-6-metoxy-1,4-benzoquinol methylase